MFWKKKGKNTAPPDSEQQREENASSVNPFSAEADSYVVPERPAQDRARQELFRGNTKYDVQGQEDVYATSRFAANEEDQEMARLKQQIRNVKQDTLESTRNTLQRLHEAEGAAGNTLSMLGEQSDQIANVHRHVNLSKVESDKAAVQAEELKQLNRSIFIPKNPFRKKKPTEELEALKQDLAEKTAERDKIRQFEYESHVRLDKAQRHAEHAATNAAHHDYERSEADKKRYQFEADAEDDTVEDEISQNVGLMGNMLSNLQNKARVMGEEIDSQTKHLTRVTKKVDPISEKLMATTHKLDKTR
ncbi:Protein transport protein S9 plasma membrane t-SNARE [Apophysomyces sp. BC1034]|nr:Protein transport protein S9 plasma membrane t-SNARE [Apophysomyces sp. BC1015]KAG0168008.1 Protein transport protein S9 plasma membrane t-SNARE [Apophysomyces sp. BC1021]KAG0184020.1 Protein transport protein S9 plasma membrane t-SNARE [Apophysomyces sp. BC1034]